MKKLPPNATNESIEMRSRILALQLIHSVLENSGPVFRNTQFFINDIREFLCLSLLKNSVSTVPSIFNLSLSIFKTLILYFKNHFKTEIGMFFTSAFLRILESSNSTYQQKILVIQVLHTICQDSQTIVDLFVNYDCALESLNIFESLVSDLSRVVQQIQAEANWVTPAQEAKIKFAGLQTIVSILKSLVEWTEKRSEPVVVGVESNSDSEKSRPSTPTVLGHSNSSNDLNHEEHFERQRHIKMDLKEGIIQFNNKDAKASKGIQFLINSGHLKQDPKEIAKFLYTQQGLDKSQIGQYIGGHEEFFREVLQAFVDLQRPTFVGKDFETAFRDFLDTFRIPGEGQMIDRILQSFASGYYGENPDTVFANADGAYVFAYSVIMLNVELHSPQLNFRPRMDLNAFIINNQGINDGQDLPHEFLGMIYNNIKNKEIKMKDDLEAIANNEIDNQSSYLSTPKKKQLLFDRESQKILKKTRDMFSSSWKTESVTTFYNASGIQHVRPMVEVSWQAILAALNALMDEKSPHGDDLQIIQLSLEGLEFGIHLSARFDMENERNEFVGALSKLTNLSNAHPMKAKHIDAIKLLLKVAETEGNYLKGAWTHVLAAVSQLERLISIGSGAGPDIAIHHQDSHPSPSVRSSPRTSSMLHIRRRSEVSATHQGSMPPTPRSATSQSDNHILEVSNSQVVMGSIETHVIDKIFTRSADLNDDAVVEFVRCLCEVSTSEISNEKEPRKFSLQKLIEVAYYNMSRIKLVWSRIWVHLANHFVEVGRHLNETIAMHAIDSTRQLAMKFLEQDELANYHFQRDFLKPFYTIITLSPSASIRDLIVQCVGQMILKRAANIKSGWKSILQIFTAAAKDTQITVVSLAYKEFVTLCMNQFFSVICQNEAFVDLVNCMVEYGKNQLDIDISTKAIASIRQCAQNLAENKVDGIAIDANTPTPFTDSKPHFKVWFPILTGLSQLISDPRLQVRTTALETLFDVLTTYGSMFSEKLWEVIFTGVLFPIFDDIRRAPDEERSTEVDEKQRIVVTENSEWINTTCERALSLLIELFAGVYDRIAFMFRDILHLIRTCFKQERRNKVILSDHLGAIGNKALLQLVTQAGAKFTDENWDDVCKCIHTLCSDMNAPTEILQDGGNNTTGAFVQVQCRIQLLIMQSIMDIVMSQFNNMKTEHVQQLLRVLDSSYQSAKLINESGSHTKRDLPYGDFLKQEALASTVYLNILFYMYSIKDEKHQDRVLVAEELLFARMTELITRYGAKPNQTNVKELENLIPIIVLLLNGFLAFDEQQFAKYLHKFYPMFTGLILSEHHSVRLVLKQLFERAEGK
jgi:brefeldin A-inhibited guanine nucleotide-exchange protein